jgi:hypothetical protein
LLGGKKKKPEANQVDDGRAEQVADDDDMSARVSQWRWSSANPVAGQAMH